MSRKFSSQIHQELKSFILIGLLGTLTDFLLYFWWHHYFYYSAAKTMSFICGSCLVYVLNKYITFQQTQHVIKDMPRFIALYLCTMFINVSSNSFVIALIKLHFAPIWQEWPTSALIFAFLTATSISTIINFIGQKFWVFKFPTV